MKRRRFLALSAQAAFAAALPSCKDSTGPDGRRARLTARPGTPTQTATKGRTALMTGSSNDGFLFVPDAYVATTPVPLVVALHGFGGHAVQTMDLFEFHARQFGFVLLGVGSRGVTWDAIRGGTYGDDIVVMDRALKAAFGLVNVDSARVTIGGFSDGASYALGVGLTNGDLFSRIIALSPGELLPYDPHGMPKIFQAHGTQDTTLPIDQTSRVIVPALEARGYTVQYQEFTGGHTINASIANQAFQWAIGP